ncbi:MAG: hypothetical protein R3F61_04415 [Myxococcota bacterium]
MIALWLAAAQAHVPILYVFGPEDDWCGFLSQTVEIDGALFYPGDVVILEPGEYSRCAVWALYTDTDTEFTVIQASDPDDPPRFVHDGGPEPMLDIMGTHIQVFDLAFESVPAGATGLRVHDIDHAWFRFAEFTGIAGTGMRVEGAASDLWVLDDRFETEAGGVGLQLGCEGCAQNVRVRDDLVLGAGTGIVSAPGAVVEITDVVFGGPGDGVQVWGGPDTSFLTGNLFVDVGAALEVHGGPLVVRNNLVRATGTAISASDDGTASFERVRVLGNSFAGGAVELGAVTGAGFEVADNAGVSGGGAGNVPCDGACWRDPAMNDFYPAAGSPLLGAGEGTTDDALFEDFCGQERVEPRTAGAIQFVGDIGWDPLTVGFKSDFQCSIVGPPGKDTGFQETDDEAPKCGCAQAGDASFGGRALGIGLFLGFLVRRRSASTAAASHSPDAGVPAQPHG